MRSAAPDSCRRVHAGFLCPVEIELKQFQPDIKVIRMLREYRFEVSSVGRLELPCFCHAWSEPVSFRSPGIETRSAFSLPRFNPLQRLLLLGHSKRRLAASGKRQNHAST